MLSSVGVTELLLLFVIGLLILGPERLPRVASQLGRWIGKARRTANQLRFQMEREIALADIERTRSKKHGSGTPSNAESDEDRHAEAYSEEDGDPSGTDSVPGKDSAAANTADVGSAAESGDGDSVADRAGESSTSRNK